MTAAPTGPGDRIWPHYAAWVQRPVLALTPSQKLLRGIFDGTTFLLAKRCAGVAAMRSRVGGVPGLRLTPENGTGDRLLYLHGGGFTIGSSTSHRHMVAHIARAAGCTTFLPDYRRAPEHPFPAALDDTRAAYAAMAADGPVMVAGDSAGGALALSLLHALGSGTPPPAALVLLSPVADLDLAQGSFQRSTDTELLIPEGWARRAVAAYLDGHDPADPLASPLAAPFPCAPPTLIQYASGEALEPDSLHTADALRAAGGPVTVEATPGVAHVWHLHAGRSHAADTAIARIGAFLREHTP